MIFCSNPVPSIDRVLYWGRYIDDIIFVWNGSVDELHQFMSRLNDNQLNIKLTYKWGRKYMDFLDIQLHIDDLGFIVTDLFRKPTATNSVLHASSGHPSHLINNIPVGQYLCLRRICLKESFFELRAHELKDHFF